MTCPDIRLKKKKIFSSKVMLNVFLLKKYDKALTIYSNNKIVIQKVGATSAVLIERVDFTCSRISPMSAHAGQNVDNISIHDTAPAPASVERQLSQSMVLTSIDFML